MDTSTFTQLIRASPDPGRCYCCPSLDGDGDSLPRSKKSFVDLRRTTSKETLVATQSSHFDLELEGEGEFEYDTSEPSATSVVKNVLLEASTKAIDFELVNVYEKAHKSFQLMNISDKVLEVRLVIMHEQWLRDFKPGLASVSPQDVVLRPNESAEITITVRPTRTTLQNFFLIFELMKDGKVVEKEKVWDEEEVERRFLLDFSFVGDHAVFSVTDILLLSSNACWDARQCWHMFSLDLFNKYLKPYKHTADEGLMIPSVPEVEFHFPAAPLGAETAVFQVQLSNPAAAGVSGFWRIWTQPPLDWRKIVDKAKDIESKKSLKTRAIFKEGKVKDNPELLGILWGRKFGVLPIDKCGNKSFKQLQSAPKCRINDHAETGMFEVGPLTGKLEGSGKDCQILTFKYSYQKVGAHKMSLLFRVYPAIFVWIDLIGHTLTDSEAFIQPIDQPSFNMSSISLADLDPPLQMLWVFNGGAAPAPFTIDQDPFKEIKKANYDHAVFECLTPLGLIPPRSWFAIMIRFSPIEFQDYTLPLRIIPEFDQPPTEILVTGAVLFQTAVMLRAKAVVPEQRFFSLRNTAIPVSLNPAMIAFPHFIPTGQKATTVVFLTNTHGKNQVSFFWPDIPIPGDGLISFHPQSGRIGPKEEVACQVTVVAGNLSATFATTVRCIIEDETKKLIYQYEMEERNMKAEMIDAPKPPPPRKGRKEEKIPVPPLQCAKLLSISLYIGSVWGLLDSINPKEKMRLPPPDTVRFGHEISANPDHPAGLILSQFETELGEQVISNILLDLFQTPDFETYVRLLTKRNAPLYEEYKAFDDQRMEKENNADFDINDLQEDQEIPLSMKEDILEAAVFNMVQELGTNWMEPSTKKNWVELAPVQPTASLDVSAPKVRKCLQKVQKK